MELTKFKDLLSGGSVVRPELPPMGQDFCELLESHGEVQLDMASGKKYSVHLGDTGMITDRALTVRLFDGRLIKINWEQVETVWFHLGNDD